MQICDILRVTTRSLPCRGAERLCIPKCKMFAPPQAYMNGRKKYDPSGRKFEDRLGIKQKTQPMVKTRDSPLLYLVSAVPSEQD